MKFDKHKNCPICGTENSINERKNFTDIITPEGYSDIKIGPLSGHFCSQCGEGFLDRESEKLFDKQIAEEKAKQDSKRLTASEITDVDFVVKKINVSRQRVHKMMEEGKLPYVFIGERRYPVKNQKIFDELRKKVRTQALLKNKKNC
ncbi:MAG: type II toxin-antitoxin system MqsA family antitoxin [Spirochaetota bacterium]